MSSSIVWFRQDLRLSDHQALTAAVQRGDAVIPLYIWSPEEEGEWPLGGASKWWLQQSLKSLDEELQRFGSRLILKIGPAERVLNQVLEESGAEAVYWSRRYEPEIVERDQVIKSSLSSRGIQAKSFNGSLLIEPWEIQTKTGAPYQVFSPFWKRVLELGIEQTPLPAPVSIPAPDEWIESASLEELELLPTIAWDGEMSTFWIAGSKGAAELLEQFLEQAVSAYKEERDRPALDATSRLSPYLHLGAISPLEIYTRTVQMMGREPKMRNKTGEDHYLSEIGWREFAYHLLYHFPATTTEPLRDQFKSFPWDDNEAHYRLWTKGRTGYPIVDAGMRQLWALGWMHNRVRMIVASFLTKDLFIPWQRGAEWFWDTLIDADLASNTLGWQWTAGCGADAAPYFRIFNPISQGEKFDPQGEYIREWIPELAELPNKYIHQPWSAPGEILTQAKIELGSTYPHPLVDHAKQRELALARFEEIKKTA